MLMLTVPAQRKMSPKYPKQLKKEGKPTLLQFSPLLSPEGTAYGERAKRD